MEFGVIVSVDDYVLTHGLVEHKREDYEWMYLLFKALNVSHEKSSLKDNLDRTRAELERAQKKKVWLESFNFAMKTKIY